MTELDTQFIDGQLNDAKQQLQKVLTSLFMAEDRLRNGADPKPITANRIFELRKQLSKTMHSALGDTPCIQPHNQLLG